MVQLYQFPISHYCEKVRWALDFKGVEYQTINLLPGFHIKKIKQANPKSSVPVLVDGKKTLQNSADIITYLDTKYPQNALTPINSEEKQQALDWERYLDENLGVPVRLCCYHILLEHPKIVIPFLTHKGPWYGKFLLKFAFPKLQQKMRYFMQINEENFHKSKAKIHAVVDKINERLSNGKFLVGNNFSRVDLTAAALLAPFKMPKGYGLELPQNLPKDLQKLFSEFEEKIDWVEKIYQKYR
ncbi:MAG: glutathione S-transferase family protein [Gammaproteobacteria bacterium]|jgi:glutathione S-transferase|nr:glutathione S-transferase family protein [Xanthomonadales bacterium]